MFVNSRPKMVLLGFVRKIEILTTNLWSMTPFSLVVTDVSEDREWNIAYLFWTGLYTYRNY
jgi:hypothetical protein